MKRVLILLLLGKNISLYATPKDTLGIENQTIYIKNIALPSLMISYGFLSNISSDIRSVDYEIKDIARGSRRLTVDDYLIYAPLAIDLGLSLANHKSKHNYPQKLGRYLMSTVMNGLLVYPVKSWTDRQRPDMSDLKSFPSGHTSNAFVGAEFFWQEYHHQSKWLASSGYLIAATTGYLRIHNNKHWFSDVVTGAGIGILSTKITFWLYPKIMFRIFPSRTSLQK